MLEYAFVHPNVCGQIVASVKWGEDAKMVAFIGVPGKLFIVWLYRKLGLFNEASIDCVEPFCKVLHPSL
jgi:hypothetical protein